MELVPRALSIAFCMSGALVIAQQSRAQPSIRLEPCRISDIDGLASTEARCGTLAVPENPSEPDGDRIRLAVAVVPAISTTARLDPLVLIAGGPGQGSIEGYAPHAAIKAPVAV